MKNYYMKSRMLFSIIMMSIVIFILAYGAYIMSFMQEKKDVAYFSNHYLTSEFQEENPTIASVLKILDENEYSRIAFLDKMSGYQFVPFDTELFEWLDINANQYTKMKKTGNYAFVSQEKKNQCYLENGQYQIDICGKQYCVLNFFDVTDKVDIADCYINVQAENAQDCNMYESLVIDLGKKRGKNVKSKLKKYFSDAEISAWDGKEKNIIDTSDIYFYVVALCAVVLCVNCSSFTDMWVKSYEKELNVRMLVGADLKGNHLFLIKEYFHLFVKASVVGIIVALVLYKIFYLHSDLTFVREIFGSHIRILSVLLALVSVWVITYVALELRFRMLEKRNGVGK